MACGIYAIVNPVKDMTYIGASVNISRRLRKHKKLLHHGQHKNMRLQADWNIDPSAFLFMVLRDDLTPETLEHWENLYIKSFDIEAIYNRSWADAVTPLDPSRPPYKNKHRRSKRRKTA